MSNRDPDATYERELSQAFSFAWLQEAKRLLHTGYFGIILDYNPMTKRARVQPALRKLYTDNTPPSPKPPLLNIPVQQPATSGYMVHHEVGGGDIVWLSFSERGLDQFKANWGQVSDPAPVVYFSEREAVAFLWGVEDIAPARSTGWVVQNRSGESYISLDGDTIRLVTGDSSIVMTPQQIVLRSPQVTFQADRIDDTGR